MQVSAAVTNYLFEKGGESNTLTVAAVYAQSGISESYLGKAGEIVSKK